MAVQIEDAAGVERIATATAIADRAQERAARLVEGGHPWREIDREIADYIRELGGVPAFADYKGFPNRSLIPSVNEVICNGVVGRGRPTHGDIVSLAVAVLLDGYYAKTEETYWIGEPRANARALVEAAYASLAAGLEQIHPGKRLGDIGAAIGGRAQDEHAFGVVEAYCGHGIGRELHMQPQLPCVGRPGTGLRLKPGMVLYVMSMLTEGSPLVTILDDGWTAVTRDGKLAANVARMVAVTDDGMRILPDGVGGRPTRELAPQVLDVPVRDDEPELEDEVPAADEPWYAKLWRGLKH